MPWNGSGVFARIYSWVADRDAEIDILADRMDQDTDDIAQGLMHCLTVNGETVPTANLPMANYRHTGASAGVANTDYCTIGQIKNGGGGLPSGGYLPINDGAFTGTMTGQAITVTGRVTAANFTATGGAGSIFDGPVTVSGPINASGQVTANGVNCTAGMTVTLFASFNGGIEVTGGHNATVGGNITATNIHATGNLTVDGSTNAGGGLTVSGGALTATASASFAGAVTFNGSVTFNGAVNWPGSGPLTLPATTFTGDVNLSGSGTDLAVGGNLSVGGGITSVAGTTSVHGISCTTLTASGAVSLDSTVFTQGVFTTHNGIKSDSNGGQEIGSASLPYGQIYSTGGTPLPSDRRLKTEIEALPPSLALVEAIEPKRYRWREGGWPAGVHWGFIAQEVEAAMAGAGHEFAGHQVHDDADRRQTLNYSELIAVLWQAVRELTAEVRELRELVTPLEPPRA